jgi:hypothetical protein
MLKRSDSATSFQSSTYGGEGLAKHTAGTMDRERVEKLLGFFALMAKQRKALDLVKVVIQELKSLIQF